MKRSPPRRPKAPVKPQLEKLEDRTMPSTSPMQAEVSPTINRWEQAISLLQQDISNDIQAVDQAITDIMSLLNGTPSSSPPAPPTSPSPVPAPSNTASSPTTISPTTNTTLQPMATGGAASGSLASGSNLGTSGTGGLGGGTSSGGGIYVSGSGMPAGLMNVSQMATSYLKNSIPYAETHNLNQSESNSVSVTQSGSGSAGTFQVTVTGSSKAGDTASGTGNLGGPSGPTENGSGNASGSNSYQLVMAGTYSNGDFTVTSETYSANGSSNSSQTTTFTVPGYSQEGDSTNGDKYTESWSAGDNSSGQLVVNSYSLTETVSAYSHNHDNIGSSESTDGSSNATTTITATGQGSTGTYTGTETLNTTSDNVIPNSPPTPPSSSSQSQPVSGSFSLSSLLVQPSGWQWFAGTSNATNYSFSGGTTESATLSETATWHSAANSYNPYAPPTLVVNSFNSAYQNTDTGHVIDDEPGTPASPGGTDSFHRDETYTSGVSVTGSGAYGPGITNATFQSVQTGTYNVADTESDNNETLTGTDANGNPYTMICSYLGTASGNGSSSATMNYQDTGGGLALTSESFQGSASAQSGDTLSGTLNGQAFSTSSTVPESWSDPAETIPGSSTPIANPQSLVGSFPFSNMASPNAAVFQAPGGGVFMQWNPARAVAKGPQAWYKYQIQRIGQNAKLKVGNLAVHRQVMDHIRDTSKAMDTFTLQGTNLNAQGQPVAGPRGNTFAQAVGDTKLLEKSKKANLEALQGSYMKDAQLGDTNVVVTYAVDGAANAARSGNVVVTYLYVQTYTGTNRFTGKQQTENRNIMTGPKIVQFHDDNLENMGGLK